MSEHTQGEWRVNNRMRTYAGHGDSSQSIVVDVPVVHGISHTVCEIPAGYSGEPCPMALADARLIAAAPELLAALSDALEELLRIRNEEGGTEDSFGMCRCGLIERIAAARAAIAKAGASK